MQNDATFKTMKSSLESRSTRVYSTVNAMLHNNEFMITDGETMRMNYVSVAKLLNERVVQLKDLQSTWLNICTKI